MPDVRVVTARPHRLLRPMIRRIGELHREGKPCMMLVPEQFTLQAERELLEQLNLMGLFSIEVVSPTRLKHRVTESAGADERAPLSPAGQQMAVSFALETCAEQLSYYRGSVSRHGFAQKLAALITDMKRGGLQPGALAEYALTLPEGMRREKFADLAALYSAYEQTLGDRLQDGDDLNQFVTDRLPESGLVQDRHVFVYGFDALPEQLIALLCAIATQCESLTVGLIADSAGAADQDIYLPVRRSVARFRKALDERGLKLTETPLPKEALDHAPAIAHLDAALFAYPQTRFEGVQENVILSGFHSPFEEATAVTRQVMRLHEQGIPLERIAVLYPDQNGYPFAVAAALSNSGLPFYTDTKLPALSHSLPQFVMAALRAMADGYRSEDMFELIKTGYAPIGFDDACMLENYAREYGINFGRWFKPFRLGDDVVRTWCEALRKRVTGPLVRARKAVVSARNAEQSLQAVVELLSEVSAYDTLKKEEDALLQEGLLVRAGQNSQIWQAILEMLEQLYILSGGRRIALKYIADRFESGFAAISLAALPPAAHMLHAGVLGHYLSGEMDAVFLLGMNDGVLTRGSESLLTDEERVQAQENTRTFLGMTEESRLLFAKLDLKRAMTLPKQYLYLSFSRTDPAGNTLQPLDLANDMADRLFETLPDLSDLPDEYPVSAQQALVALSDLLRAYADGDEEQLPDIWKRRLAVLLAAPDTAVPAVQLVRAAGFRVATLPLAPETAKKLFGDRTMSVSRLEDYAACPFRHYVTYGLQPEERRDWAVTPIETGNFFHDCLQRFVKIAAENPEYPHVAPDEVQRMAETASAPLIGELKIGPMGDGPRSLAALAQAARVVQRACTAVTGHLAAGDFSMGRAEARFGYPGADSFPPVILNLPDGTEITLHGRIDRIDRYDAPDAVYRRVVDYKSGQYAVLDAAELWHGAQLQLMLYLDAVTRNTGDAKPAGAFYFHLFDPMSKVDSDQAEAVNADIQKQLQMSGIALADPDVLRAMDSGGEAVAVASVVTQTGAVRKNAKVLDADQLDALMRHAKGKAVQFSGRMLAGDISIQPLKHGAKQSCDFCEYRTICGYDPLARGARGMEIFSISQEELAGRLDREIYPEAPA